MEREWGGRWRGGVAVAPGRTTIPTRAATMTAMIAPAAAPALLPSSVLTPLEGLPEIVASPVDEKASQIIGWSSSTMVTASTCKLG